MQKNILISAALSAVVLIAGCGGSGSGGATTAALSGVVADGYLKGAEVFLDKNGNYQWDEGEPKTMSGPGGVYKLDVAASDIGKHPVVVRVIPGSTVDEDSPGQPLHNGYIMSAPVGFCSFISPMSTLVREKLEANPGMTLAEAMVQLRNQLNMPAGVDMFADYVAGSHAGQHQADYQDMHRVAQHMAALMAGQSGLVMSGNSVHKGRYRVMMGEINSNLPQVADNAYQGMGMNSSFITAMLSWMQTKLAAISTGDFGNHPEFFGNMTSHHDFWNDSGSGMHPVGGTFGGGMMGGGTTGGGTTGGGMTGGGMMGNP